MWTKHNSAKVLSLLLIGVLSAPQLTPVFATELSEEVTPSTGNVLLTVAEAAEPAVFSVTVPTSFPVFVDGYGNASTANNTAIINNSNSAVRVVDMGVGQAGSYNIVGYEEDFSTKYLNSNQIALNINGSKTRSDGSLAFLQDAFPAIPAGGIQQLPYAAKVTGSTDEHQDTHAANVYLTIDWHNPINLTYDANGGIFTNGAGYNTIKYTTEGRWIGGAVEEPTRNYCTFAGWYLDINFTTPYDGHIPTSHTTVYAKWTTTYTVRHSWQTLDNSYVYDIHEEETFVATVGETVWPETKTYDQYKTPSQQALKVDASGNCVLTYKYERTQYWLDVNFVVDGVFTGGPSDPSWPAALNMNFMKVYINGYDYGGGRDFCRQLPFDSYYSVVVDLPEGFYYAGTYNEGADTWNNGTTLYRRPASGRLTENVGIRLIINSVEKAQGSYTIAFDANGGDGTMETMTMLIGTDAEGTGTSELKALLANNFTREGYTFGGWATAPDADEPVYSDEQEIYGLTAADGDVVTLYAFWVPNTTFGLIEDELVEEEVVDDEENTDEETDETPPDTEENPEDSQHEEQVDPSDDTHEDSETTTPELPSKPDNPEAPESPGSEETPGEDEIDNPALPPETDNPQEETDDIPEEIPETPPKTEETPDEPETPEEPTDEEPEGEAATDPAPPADDSEESDETSDATENPTTEPDNEKPPDDDVTREETKTDTDEEEIPTDDESSMEESTEDTEPPVEDKEKEEEDEEPVVEPVYYCGLEIHVHGEDCANSASCDTEEHRHDTSCLYPKPPEEPEPDDETEPPAETEPSNEVVETPSEVIEDKSVEEIVREDEKETPPEPPENPPEEPPATEEPSTPPVEEPAVEEPPPPPPVEEVVEEPQPTAELGTDAAE